MVKNLAEDFHPGSIANIKRVRSGLDKRVPYGTELPVRFLKRNSTKFAANFFLLPILRGAELSRARS